MADLINPLPFADAASAASAKRRRLNSSGLLAGTGTAQRFRWLNTIGSGIGSGSPPTEFETRYDAASAASAVGFKFCLPVFVNQTVRQLQ